MHYMISWWKTMKAGRNERRIKTARKLAQRVLLKKKLGLQGGCIYERHREKIEVSAGYMRTGNVSHFVSVRPTRKTRSRDRYGRVFSPSKRDAVRIENMNDQVDSLDEDQ